MASSDDISEQLNLMTKLNNVVERMAKSVSSIESSYETIFNEHFAVCDSCRRLVQGVRESLTEPEQVEVPSELYERIFAATSRVAAGGSRR